VGELCALCCCLTTGSHLPLPITVMTQQHCVLSVAALLAAMLQDGPAVGVDLSGCPHVHHLLCLVCWGKHMPHRTCCTCWCCTAVWVWGLIQACMLPCLVAPCIEMGNKLSLWLPSAACLPSAVASKKETAAVCLKVVVFVTL
jgi:hypothetical protein